MRGFLLVVLLLGSLPFGAAEAQTDPLATIAESRVGRPGALDVDRGAAALAAMDAAHRARVQQQMAKLSEDQTARPNDPLPASCHAFGGIWRDHDGDGACWFSKPERRGVFPACDPGTTAALYRRPDGLVEFNCH